MDNIITNADGVKVKVRVYDFGDEVADRYTIVYVNKNIKDGYGGGCIILFSHVVRIHSIH